MIDRGVWPYETGDFRYEVRSESCGQFSLHAAFPVYEEAIRYAQWLNESPNAPTCRVYWFDEHEDRPEDFCVWEPEPHIIQGATVAALTLGSDFVG